MKMKLRRLTPSVSQHTAHPSNGGMERNLPKQKRSSTASQPWSSEDERTKKEVVYAFIDSQNLNLGTSKNIIRGGRRVHTGWKLDFQKFMRFLQDKFRVSKAFLFIGYVEENQELYKRLTSYGYTLVYKPTVNDNEGKPKGNVDAELVLHASAVEYREYQKAVVVSGDGDFTCLHEYLQKRNKLKAIIIPNRYSESSLLKNFGEYKIFLNREKRKLEYEAKRTNTGGNIKTAWRNPLTVSSRSLMRRRKQKRLSKSS